MWRDGPNPYPAVREAPKPFIRVFEAVDVRLLGPVEVVDGTGTVLHIPGARPRALLAVLALHTPNVVSTDHLLETLWGDEPIASPESSLHVAVSRLRGAIGQDNISTVAGGYRLEIAAANSDVERFRRHAQRGRQFLTLGHPAKAAEGFRHALAQWRGDPLVDLRQFEFAEQASRQLAEERMSVVEALMDAELAAGDHQLVVGELSGLVDEFPLRERLWGQLMLALYRSGRQADALRTFQRLKTTLGEELGIEPSQELVDLEERILLHDPALDDRLESPAEDWPEEPEYLNFEAGEVIVEEGAPADTVYWVEEGLVEVFNADPDGGTTVLAELGPGHYFGELASLLGTGRTASVRAATFTTVSLHSVHSFRSRLGVERTKPPTRPDGQEAVKELVDQGQYLQAYDLAAGLLESGSGDSEIRYLAVLALARSGATDQARRRYDSLGLGSIAPASVPPQLAEDIVALAASLDKRMALVRSGEDRIAWSVRSAAGYQKAFEQSGSAYLAVNAATMWMLAGQDDRAGTSAHEALAALAGQSEARTDDDLYWDAATEAEAALVLGEVGRAGDVLARAGQASQGNWAARAVTLQQLKLVCEHRDLDPDVLAPIHNPAIAHFCGHRILPPGQTGRFPVTEEEQVADQLEKTFDRLGVGIGFGSLAAGADILAAEALLARGAELQVVLPFDRDEFVRTSVAPAGPEWAGRFDRCLAEANNVVTAVSSEYLDDPVLFDFCSQIAMGDALIRSRFLQARVHQIAVWDGVESDSPAGTAVDVAHWAATGREPTIIPVTPGTPSTNQPARQGRRIAAIVFADFAGFSKLTDAQLVVFQDKVMGGLAEALEPFQHQLLSGRTWGDGLYLVFDDIASAAESALLLQEKMRELDFRSVGLGEIKGMRVAAHATPVFDGWDPIAGTRLFYGAGVTQTARIEPRTPEGEIYTTHPFAALAILAGDRTFDCQYVGTMPTAKDYGTLPLFTLRRRRSLL